MLGQPLYKAVTQHAKRIQDIHLRLDVTGTYLQHDVPRTPAHMRTTEFVVKMIDAQSSAG